MVMFEFIFKEEIIKVTYEQFMRNKQEATVLVSMSRFRNEFGITLLGALVKQQNRIEF